MTNETFRGNVATILSVFADCADMVEFSIVLTRDGQENIVLPVICPGRKPLIDHIRPLLTSSLDLQSIGHERRIVIQLKVGSLDQANWSSPAELFAVSSSMYSSRCRFTAQHVQGVTDAVTFIWW